MAHVAVQLGNFETRLTLGRAPSPRGALAGVARPDREHPDILTVPSLVHLEPLAVGEEVVVRGLRQGEYTFRDLRDHVLHPLSGGRCIGGRRVTHKEAASVFLRTLVSHLREELGEEVDLAVLCPVLGRAALHSWLEATALTEARSIAVVDEDTAAAIGYGIDLTREGPLLVFDFGYSSLQARVLQFRRRGGHRSEPPLVRASATAPFGYADLVLHGPEGTGRGRGEVVAAAETRGVLTRALEEGLLDGVRPEDIGRVLLLGRGGRLEAVRNTLAEVFGDRLVSGLPLAAPLRGGLALCDGTAPDAPVHEAFRLRVRDTVTGEYDYPVVVESDTPCPSPGPTASYIVNTYYDGQRAMDLHLFRTIGGNFRWEDCEVVFGPDGRLGFVHRESFEVQEPALEQPLVIPVDPPGRKGQRRFRLEFRVDAAKHLLVTVVDLLRDHVLWDERPVAGFR